MGGFVYHIYVDRGNVVELLQSWIEEGDAQEQREAGEYLIRALGRRSSLRPSPLSSGTQGCDLVSRTIVVLDAEPLGLSHEPEDISLAQ